ncbi:MAG: nitronate monooxygenase, partial [Bacteroidaceae bacterium]|nr:nitronate monooxygenase [Bacteroidaceae bacterium]
DYLQHTHYFSSLYLNIETSRLLYNHFFLRRLLFTILSTVTGGMSGAAVKPIALRMVWQVAQAVKIPVIGLGGIMNWRDAVEFLLAGATAIQIGTANFIDPAITVKVAEGINDYLDRHGFSSVEEIIGGLEIS